MPVVFVIIITQVLLDGVAERPKASLRLGKNLDLWNTAADGSQSMLNTIEPGSPLPIHRHRKSSETVVALSIPIGQWHTVRVLESGTVIMEVKDGAYEPIGEEDILEV